MTEGTDPWQRPRSERAKCDGAVGPPGCRVGNSIEGKLETQVEPRL